MRRFHGGFGKTREHRGGGVQTGISRKGWGRGFGEFEVRRDLGDALLDGRVGREKVEPRLGEAVPKKHVARFLSSGMVEARGEVSDFSKGAGDAVRAAGELHGGGVGEKFALAADGGLDELREENSNPSDEIQNRAGPEEQRHNRAAVFVVAGPAPGRRGGDAHEDSAEDGEEEDSVQ